MGAPDSTDDGTALTFSYPWLKRITHRARIVALIALKKEGIEAQLAIQAFAPSPNSRDCIAHDRELLKILTRDLASIGAR